MGGETSFMKKTVFLLLLTIVLVVPFVSAQEEVVITNTRNWHELYLGAFFALSNDDRFMFFDSLFDSNVKSQTINRATPVLILEQDARPVVKNYHNLLRTRGYTTLDSFIYDDYVELQEELFSRGSYDGIVLIYDVFGIEALALFPYMLENNLFPFFINQDNERTVLSDAGNNVELAVGYFPVRMLEDLSFEVIRGLPEDNSEAISRRFFEQKNSDWGLLVNAQEADFTAFASKNPAVVFNEELLRTSELIAESGITRFEAIGAEMANIAQALRDRAEHDLRFILRYAQTYTNIEGMTGQILALSRVQLPAPIISLSVVDARVYEDLNTLTFTIENSGSLPGLFFSNFELGDVGFADSRPHVILPGKTRTIPYVLDDVSGERLTANIIFGFSEPLTRTLTGRDGATTIREDVIRSSANDNSNVVLEQLSFDDNSGLFYARIRNEGTTNSEVVVEIYLDNSSSVLSLQETIEANSYQDIIVPALYVERGVVIDNSFDVEVFFGEERITKRVLFEDVLVASYRSLNIIYVAALALVLFAIIIWFVLRKKKQE